MYVGDCSTVLVDHHVTVVHPHDLLLDSHDGGEVPEDKKPVLTSYYDLSLMNCGT